MSNAETSTPVISRASPWRWWVCLLLMLATVVNYMDRMALNQMANRIMAEFGLDNTQYSQLESLFSLAFGTGAFCAGMVVDRVSVRWVYPLMILGWSCAGVLTGFANSFAMLLACRFFLGLFEAGNWPCGIRTTRAVLRPAERSFGNSLFQSGTALGAVITPLVIQQILDHTPEMGPSEQWRIPFRIIGSLGFVWIALWFLTVPKRIVDTVGTRGDSKSSEGATRFADVFQDKRFWALVALTITINWCWHGYRTWLPLYLQKQRGYTEPEMNKFMMVYYIVADIGAWTVGLSILGLYAIGVGIHRSRLLAFGACSLLTSGSIAVPFLPNGWPMITGLLAIAFGALSLFPIYFALTQEISSMHQGKVTGTLGLLAHSSLSLIYPVEGKICDWTHSYEWVLGGIGVLPFLAFGLLLWFWSSSKDKNGVLARD